MIECESCGALWEETQIPNLVPRALFPQALEAEVGPTSKAREKRPGNEVRYLRLHRQNLPRTRTSKPARRLTASRSPYLSLSSLCLRIFTEDS